MADEPLSSATDRRLGEPLPHQLANQTQAHPIPMNLWPSDQVVRWHYEVLIPVSRRYPSVWGRLPTRYSPVRRFPLVRLSEDQLASFSLDLHVLGTPPAFILSQDQTLNKWYLKDRFRSPKSSLSFLTHVNRFCASLFFLSLRIIVFLKKLYV